MSLNQVGKPRSASGLRWLTTREISFTATLTSSASDMQVPNTRRLSKVAALENKDYQRHRR